MASKPKKSSKTRKLTRAEVLAHIDALAQEIMDDVQIIAQAQKHMVEHGFDVEQWHKMDSSQGSAFATLHMLCYKIRNRGEVA
ncbi:MAG: hypothetical protein WCI02_06670 [Planctomycetota bacterium]